MNEEATKGVFLEVVYDGKPMELSEEEAIKLAQKGMNYDRLAQKFNSLLDDYNALLEYRQEIEGILANLEGENKELSKVKQKEEQIKEFSTEYPDVDVRSLDKAIVAEWEKGEKSLLDIYNQFMMRQLNNQKSAEVVNEKTTKASTGSVSGIPQNEEMFTDDMIKNMSDKELVKNFKSILKQYK